MKKLISIIMSLLLSSLKGGHSGVEIDKGRLNGIKALFFAGLTEQFDRRRFSLGFTIDEKVEIKTIAGEQDFAVVF